MPRVRGATALWKNVAVSAGGFSKPGSVGTAPYVAVFIENNGATPTIIDVQSAGMIVPIAGENADLTNLPWYDYVGFDTVTVPVGAKVCIDLSIYAPQYLRLKSSAATTLTATMVTSGG